MQIKKFDKANLEKKRTIFLEIGFVVALSLVLVAFEWTKSDLTDSSLGSLNLDEEVEEDIINTFREEMPPPPPPPPPPQVTEVLDIVEDDEEIEEELEIEDTEADEDTEIEIVEYEEEEESDEIFEFYMLEDKPTFPGGDAALMKFLGSAKYPEMARENDIEGRVFVGFVIDKTGAVTNVRVMRPVDPLLDKEAIRVVKSMPKWTPGKQRGRPVKASYSVPINFTLMKR